MWMRERKDTQDFAPEWMVALFFGLGLEKGKGRGKIREGGGANALPLLSSEI